MLKGRRNVVNKGGSGYGSCYVNNVGLRHLGARKRPDRIHHFDPEAAGSSKTFEAIQPYYARL